MDRKSGFAQELSVDIQNADLLIQLRSVVRHKDRRDAVHILLDGTLQLLSVRAFDGDLVAALQAFVFNLRRHLAVQRDQGQSPVLDHARGYVRLGCDVQLFEAAVHARTQCGRDIVVFGLGQLFVQLADLILHRGHRAQHAGQVQGRDRIALPELRVGRHDDLVDLDPLGNRDGLGVDILDIPGAADPGADAAVGGLFAENLVLVRGHARIDLSAQHGHRDHQGNHDDPDDDQRREPALSSFLLLGFIQRLKQRIVVSFLFIHGASSDRKIQNSLHLSASGNVNAS